MESCLLPYYEELRRTNLVIKQMKERDTRSVSKDQIKNVKDALRPQTPDIAIIVV